MTYAGIARLGIGISYHREFDEVIFGHPTAVDFIELITEKCFAEAEKNRLERLAETRPVVCHGLHLSIGTAEALDESYLTNLSNTLSHFRPIWFSDHLSMSHAGGIDIGHLAPLAFTAETLEVVSQKIVHLKKRFAIPFLLENITYYFSIPGAEMTEWEFIRRVLERADCGMLLDLNNLFINAKNHDYDPYEFLSGIPLERVVEIHLAGGLLREGIYVDTHGHSVSAEVWDYLEFVCRRAPVCGIVLERDQNFPPTEELRAELQRAREILFAS